MWVDGRVGWVKFVGNRVDEVGWVGIGGLWGGVGWVAVACGAVGVPATALGSQLHLPC